MSKDDGDEGKAESNSTHLSSILRNNPEIGEMPTLLVFDEFDKCIRPAYGSRGTNYPDLLQDNFLKMADGDLVEFGESGSFIQTDFFNVSIVFMGTFAEMQSHVSADFPALLTGVIFWIYRRTLVCILS